MEPPLAHQKKEGEKDWVGVLNFLSLTPFIRVTFPLRPSTSLSRSNPGEIVSCMSPVLPAPAPAPLVLGPVPNKLCRSRRPSPPLPYVYPLAMATLAYTRSTRAAPLLYSTGLSWPPELLFETKTEARRGSFQPLSFYFIWRKRDALPLPP